MRAELIEVVETELKRFATDLNLSDAQKGQLKTALESAHEKIDEIRAKNPNVSEGRRNLEDQRASRGPPGAGGKILHPGAADQVGR